MTEPDWNKIYERRRRRVRNMLAVEAPKPIIEAETRMLFEALSWRPVGSNWIAN